MRVSPLAPIKTLWPYAKREACRPYNIPITLAFGALFACLPILSATMTDLINDRSYKV